MSKSFKLLSLILKLKHQNCPTVPAKVDPEHELHHLQKGMVQPFLGEPVKSAVPSWQALGGTGILEDFRIM